MCKVFEGSFEDPEFRVGANFIPFTEEELKDIALFDAQSGRSWTPPPPVKPTFFELCNQLRAFDEVIVMPSNDNVASIEVSPIEAAPTDTPTVEALTPHDTTLAPIPEA